jgi:hypothetical protein
MTNTPISFTADKRALLASAGIKYGHTLKPSKADTRKKMLRRRRQLARAYRKSFDAHIEAVLARSLSIEWREMDGIPMLVHESGGRIIHCEVVRAHMGEPQLLRLTR